jgi:response regulator of citrate/malate metabolism
MLSAMANLSYIGDSLMSGAVDFIAKPFRADTLIDTVKRHLETDTVIDADEVKSWLDDCIKGMPTDDEKYEITDESLFREKLMAAIIECTNLPTGTNKPTALCNIFLGAAQKYLEPIATQSANEKVPQIIIDELLAKMSKLRNNAE